MFDIGFSELLLFGVIALIVLGPEKLPKAARTAGQWYAKLRRTVSTLQSEIEAEFDLAETRQQMQDEIAKIRQTEADIKREMAEMRGNIKQFEQSQNQSLNTTRNAATSSEKISQQQDKQSLNHNDGSSQSQNQSAAFNYAYHQQLEVEERTESPDTNINDSKISQDTTDKDITKTDAHSVNQPIATRPWENMWFRLGAYDKARRLPTPPFLPNYKADVLLNARLTNQERTKPQDNVKYQSSSSSQLSQTGENE